MLLFIAIRSEGSFQQWHIKTYLSTPATDDTYVAGGVSGPQRAKTIHQMVDEVLTVFEKVHYEARK